jgi:SAM-dependent methyltransferase
MNKKYEKTYHEVEATHWWFVTRRKLVKELVCKYAPAPDAAILEIGCSGGPLLESLRANGFSQLAGIDISPEAVALCRDRNLANVSVMDAQKPDFPPSSFEIIIASDVLEHLEDAPLALAAWHKLMRPGGTLLLFVPAFCFLWGDHDEINHHFHRYRAGELAELLHSAGFEVSRQGYWNFFLFLPVATIRLLKRFMPCSTFKPRSGDLKPVTPPLNRLLIWLLTLENHLLLRGVNFPWGVSATIIAHRPINN